MSYRGGPRAKGTDGGDYSHRETVASHYQISSTNKRRLKLCITAHVLLFFIILLKLSTEIIELLDLDFPLKNVLDFNLPKRLLWDWVWLSSILFTIAAYLGLRKNYVGPMQIYAIGTFACGICPLVSAIIYHSGDLKIFLMEKVTELKVDTFYGIPFVFVLYAFIVTAFLVHSLSIMFAVNLMRAWTPKKGKKKA